MPFSTTNLISTSYRINYSFIGKTSFEQLFDSTDIIE